MTTLIAHIKRNSLDDGPGIRSTVFYKGCPLHCLWCQNPECIRPGPELLFRPADCVGCHTCQAICPQGVLARGPQDRDVSACRACGACANVCPSGALTLVGRAWTPPELCQYLMTDLEFYRASGGGVTLSGGEPTMALDHAVSLCMLLRDQGVHLCLETSGHFPWQPFASRLLPLLDLIYVDLKMLDDRAHRRLTGQGNALILANIEELLRQRQAEVLVRIPLIPGINDGEANLAASAQWLRQHDAQRVALLPYNPLWLPKARGLGRTPLVHRESWMTPQEVQAARIWFKGLIEDEAVHRPLLPL